jgi:hypothetical protein
MSVGLSWCGRRVAHMMSQNIAERVNQVDERQPPLSCIHQPTTTILRRTSDGLLFSVALSPYTMQ